MESTESLVSRIAWKAIQALAATLAILFLLLMIWLIAAVIFEGVFGIDWPGVTITHGGQHHDLKVVN